MSVRVMSWVWENAEAGGNDRLVLLAIADEARDDGTHAWPGVARLAAKCRLSTRTVQRCIQSLEESGQLVVRKQAGGTPTMRKDRRPNLYTVVMDGASDCHPVGERGDRTTLYGVTESAERGDTAVTQPIIHPSNTRAVEPFEHAPDFAALRDELRLLERKGKSA